MRKQPAAKFLAARRQSFKIGKNTGLVGDDLVVAQNIFVNDRCFFNVGYTGNSTYGTACQATFVFENIFVVDDLEQIPVRVPHIKSLPAVYVLT
ncbi:hypothetical protein SDC9_108866 [bioreactor metagenome]|uniref:Uncharacterized protein n=1 Tax=bioreactor metagenome TaxID=1076179 RepID=A0A645BBF8_9ZZZZ